jgi:NAD(P)-dependent dehydrogenase (short-subunit alcohol dehydrogenase family)
MADDTRSALIFGARNLGKAIIETLVGDGWSVAGVARSDSTLAGVADAGALAIRADVTDMASVGEALRQAADANGPLDLVVNAAAAYGGTRSGPFGGGPLAEAASDAFDSWAAAPPRAAFTFLSASARVLVDAGRGGTIVQVTGGSSRRAMPGRGLWAAGAFGVRALTQAAALELREHGIHVALLIVDAGIKPLVGTREGVDPATLADAHQIAGAVKFLAEQGASSATHELQVTPLRERWVP